MVGMLISTVSCSHRQPYYGAETTADRTGTRNTITGLLFYKRQSENAMSVPNEDRDRHQRCVFFALEQLDLGEKCQWFSPTSGHSGEVKVVQVYPSGSKMCHVFYTTMYNNTIAKNWQDTACYSSINNKWHFISES